MAAGSQIQDRAVVTQGNLLLCVGVRGLQIEERAVTEGVIGGVIWCVTSGDSQFLFGYVLVILYFGLFLAQKYICGSRSILWIGLKQIAENRWYMSMLFGVYAGIINTHSFSFSQALCMSMKVFFFIHLAFLMSISLLIHWLLHEHCLFSTCMVARARLWPRVGASPHNTCVVIKL